MSSHREDHMFEMFSYIRSDKNITKIWEQEMHKLKYEEKHKEAYELYCLAFDLTRKRIKNELYK